jgi:hypothetical protein
MRGISSSHRATNQQAPKKKDPGKWVQFKRDVRHIKDKIRNYVMDAFRNAKSIVEINKKIQLVERKVDSSLKTSSEMEVKYRKSVNFKLLLLLGLWILDKVVLFAFFQWFNGQP